MNTENSSVLGEESEDDFDWEEVEVSQDVQPSTSATPPTNVQDYYNDLAGQADGPSEKPHLEITIKTVGKKGDPKCVYTRFRIDVSDLNVPLTHNQEE